MTENEARLAREMTRRLGLPADAELPAPMRETLRNVAASIPGDIPEADIQDTLDRRAEELRPLARALPEPTVSPNDETAPLGTRPPGGPCPTAHAPSPGPYKLLEELGHGGMGVVYRAQYRRLGSLCAVKVLSAGEHATAEALAPFYRPAGDSRRSGVCSCVPRVHRYNARAGRDG